MDARMSDDDKKVQDAKAEAERLIEELFGLATRSLERGNLSQDDDLLASGRLSFVHGSRELMRIVSLSNSQASGYEAVRLIIRGAALIGSTAIFTKKYFLARQKAKCARDAKQIEDDKHKRAFDAAVAAEAKKLNIQPAVSAKFAKRVRPALEKLKFTAGREKVLNSVRRLNSARKRRNDTGS
jgi:hypothetical protein